MLTLVAVLTTISACGGPADGSSALLQIVPASAEVAPGETLKFAATETVSWDVVDTGGGTIDTTGVYTAPGTEGTYTVVASATTAGETTWIRVKRNIRVDVTPSAATLAPGESLSLAANVTGNIKTVTWASPDGGTITTAGVYTAPQTPGTYAIVAASAADPSRSDRATITVTAAPEPPPPPPTVTIAMSPQTASLVAGSTVQFAATVTGSTNAGVSWSVAETGGGSVSGTGLYTTPPTVGTYHVVATSLADPSKTSSASVTVSSPPLTKPVISSFTASRSSITQGASSTLSWTVSGDTSLSIDNGVGPVTGLSSKSVTPLATTTYKLTATNAAGSVTATVTVNVSVSAPAPAPPAPAPTAPSRWDVTVSPPVMSNPITITLPGNYLSTISHSLCSGPGYVVNLDDTKDYIIRTNSVLHAPVHINGGRNVRIIGMHIDLDTAACSTAGMSGYVPALRALNVSQMGTTFVEGAYIDVRRRSSDAIVARNPIGGGEALSKGYSEAAARGERDVIIQNSVFRGNSCDDSVHGDLIQTQGLYELYRTVVFENVSTDSNCEGTVINSREGYSAANSITMRRFDYRLDPRYTPNLNGASYWLGGPVMNSAKAYIYDRVYLGLDVVREYGPTGSITNKSCDGSASIYCPVLPPGPDRYASPGNGAASDAWTGMNYVSPHP